MPSVKKSPNNLGGIFYMFSVGNGYKNTDQHQTKPGSDYPSQCQKLRLQTGWRISMQPYNS